MGCQMYKLPCRSKVYEESQLKCLRLSQPTRTSGDLPSDPKMFRTIYEYAENCTVGRNASTQRGKTHTETFPRETRDGNDTRYVYSQATGRLSLPSLTGLPSCSLQQKQFFFPVKNVILEFKKIALPSIVQ